MPCNDYIYFADNANCPYGTKTEGFIISRARQITEMLLQQGAEVIVVACNTATSAAITTLRKEYGVKFVGIEPAIKPAACGTRTGTIGVLATAGTLGADKFLNAKELYGNIRIIGHVGEGFVELVERMELEGPHTEEVVRASVKPLLDAGADTIVLGCTHYPFLAPAIRKVAGPEIRIIDPSEAVARQLKRVMEAEHLSCSVKEKGTVRLLASGSDSVLNELYDSSVKVVLLG